MTTPTDKKPQASDLNSSSGVNVDMVSNKPLQSADVTAEQVINWIKSRRSIGNLTTPAPSQAHIDSAIQCAMTAPDHKKLQPWRFTVLHGEARSAFGQALLEAAQAKAKREGYELDTMTAKKTVEKPLRAPLIIAVMTNMQYHEKVPAFEQLLSTGAAVQNLILALKAQGFNTVWRTGPFANEAAVKAYFNVGSEDYIAAFVYVGSSHCELPERQDIDISSFVSHKD